MTNTETNSTPTGHRAGPRAWAALAVLALPTMLLSLDQSVLFLALPQLSADLDASGTQSLWITDIYGFMIAGFLITMGTVGDRIGRRRLLLLGAAGFGLASVAAAFAPSAEALIAARAVLGITGATLMPSTLALISNLFQDAKQRALAIAVWISCFFVGGAVGPVIGGVLLESLWWGSVFLLGVPVMLSLLLLGPFLLPEYRDPRPGSVDLVSVGLSLAALLPVVFGLKSLAVDGMAIPPLAAIVTGVGFGWLFLRRQRRLAYPLLDLRLFRDRAVVAALTVLVLGQIAVGGIYLFATQYLQLAAGLSPLEAGLWLVPAVVALVAGSFLGPVAARRFGAGATIAAGLVVAAAGFGLLAASAPTTGVLLPIIGLTLGNLGAGPFGALGIDLVVGSAPPERAGAASASAETGGELGTTLGIATFGSLGSAVYYTSLADSVPPEVSDTDAQTVTGSLTGALEVAATLPERAREALLAAARDALSGGLAVVAATATALMLVLAVVAVRGLRSTTGPRAGGPEAPDANDPARPERDFVT